MKNLVVFFLFIVICKEINCISSVLEEWEAFKLKFQKKYTNDEEKSRIRIFMKNKMAIDKHNVEYKQGIQTYTMGINQFSDLEYDEFSKLLNNYEQDSTTLKKAYKFYKIFVPDNTDLPTHVDWREKGAVTQVKDQESCGSCWAFSVTGAVEGQYFMKTGELVSLSEQNLIDCHAGAGGCSGQTIDGTFKYLCNQSINSDETYPYESKVGECRFDESKAITNITGLVIIQEQNEEHLKAAVATNGPISVTIHASNSFFYYKDGVYYEENCNEKEPNHAVLVVGYGTDEKDGDYWIVKNSWSKSWALNGYIKMARNRNNNCMIASYGRYPEL